MDEILARITQQAMNYAIRSGIAITSGYAISQCSRLLKTKHGKDRDELFSLQQRLESKIRIIAPAIDMIELISARGNTSLESAVALTKSIRLDIQALGAWLANAASKEELILRGISKAKQTAQEQAETQSIRAEIQRLLERIEDAVPLISLAITTSGVSLSTSLPSTVSPSRLLQASMFLSAGDAQYMSDNYPVAQIGPTFTLSMYMLFAGHARPQNEDGLRATTWKEVIHKAKVKLLRTAIEELDQLPRTSDTPSPIPTPEKNLGERFRADKGDEFAYQILVVEDLDDGRVHSFDEHEEQPTRFDEVDLAGIREVLPVHQISKLFYADTGKILNIGNEGESNNPVILIKRDVNAPLPRTMYTARDYARDSEYDHVQNANAVAKLDEPMDPTEQDSLPRSWSLPTSLDPEWIALEVYTAEEDSDDESELFKGDEAGPDNSRKRSSRKSPVGSPLHSALQRLRLSSSPATPFSNHSSPRSLGPSATQRYEPVIKTSLSLLEMLLRLTSLQQFQQTSHLAISDELLNFFLQESATTGAGGDVEARKRIRMIARQRVGFDPYDESPIKHHGEEYQYEHGHAFEDENVSAGRDFETPESKPFATRSSTHQHILSIPSRRPMPNSEPTGPMRSHHEKLFSSPLAARETRSTRSSVGKLAKQQGSPMVVQSNGTDGETITSLADGVTSAE